MSGELIQVFGTVQQVINYSAADTGTGNFMGGTPTEFNNTNDSTVPYAEYATASLDFQMASGAIEGQTLDLYMVRKEVELGVDDTDPPTAGGSDANGAQYVGAFVTDGVTSAQQRTIVISLRGVRYADFYIKNNGGSNLNSLTSSATTLRIIPFSYKQQA